MSGWKRLFVIFFVFSLILSGLLAWWDIDRHYSQSPYHVGYDSFELPLGTTFRVCLKDSSHEIYNDWKNKALEYFGEESPNHNPSRYRELSFLGGQLNDLNLTSYQDQELPGMHVLWAFNHDGMKKRYDRHTDSHHHCEANKPGYSYSWVTLTMVKDLSPISDHKVAVEITLYIFIYLVLVSALPSALVYFLSKWVKKGF